MKGGMVVQVRVNPKDCLAVLDIMESLGINVYDGRSFASCVSVTLSSLIGVARKGGIIKAEEEEGGWEWLNRMEAFQGNQGKNTKRKKSITDNLYDRVAHGMPAPALPGLEKEKATPLVSPVYDGSKDVDSMSHPLSEEEKEALFLEYEGLNGKMNKKSASNVEKMRYREVGKMLGF